MPQKAGNLVTLMDGREVSSDSPEWKVEFLARFIADTPRLEKRRELLAAMDKLLSLEAALGLREMVAEIFERRKKEFDQG